MQMPAVAVGLWNAACVLVFIGAVATFVWQSVQFCCGAAFAAPQQNCTDCHTKVATAPMKTKTQAAFHNPTATAGICIDCHKTSAAAGKKAPAKCADCHKKENV